MSERLRDAIVVGGGPAGSALASLLAQAGHDVLLLDAARFPRDKVCGDSVSPEAWRLLDAIGATPRVRALAPQPLRGMRLVSPNGTSFRGEYRGRERVGFAVRRLVLDAALLASARDAGATVREGVRVTGLLTDDGRGVRGVTTDDGTALRARVVGGADGRRSVVARRLGLLREHPRLRRFAVRGYWDGVRGLEAFGEMHVAGTGYCGIAPLSARSANVAFVLGARELAAAAGDLEGFYRGTLQRLWPALGERLASARLCGPPSAIGPLALECRAVSAPGAVLVGDAAGFFDPFTGEGITLALRSAELAAAAIDAALQAHPSAPLPRLTGYERAYRDATRHKFRFNRLLQLAVTHRGLADAVAARLARRPDLADRMVGIAGDFVPAKTALGPRFLLDLLLA
ncbi:MAG: NAD(P)/FAD-dependent oxidoreductase [Betaproteobacteria bacterium]